MLRDAVEDDAAIRYRARLQPAGGPGDKVFPPTYAGGIYAIETRRLNGSEMQVVLLDSVQSQANRLEQALLAAYRKGKVALPMLTVSFSGIEGLEDLGEITLLDAPHRLADAIFRDSYREIDGRKRLFPDTPQGEVLRQARASHASELFKLCPTSLLFGVWDSTGSVSAEVAAKFARTLVSEIIGVNVVVGVKTASRIDPLQIANVPIYQRRADAPGECDWTAVEEDAERDAKGNPIRYAKKDSSKSKEKPSEINHGNVTPDIVRDERSREPIAGGVTVEYALHTVVLSLAGLRKLRFPAPGDPEDNDRNARTVLAALGLAAITAQIELGYDLRSRCLLVPEEPPQFEIVASDGGTRPFTLHAERAYSLLADAYSDLPQALQWEHEEIKLLPTESLVKLVQVSRERGGAAEEATDAENV
jgi:CRISPR-associated protein Csb1